MIPLWKMVYGNLTRLEQVSRQLRADPRVASACDRLEQEAAAVIRRWREAERRCSDTARQGTKSATIS